MIKKELKVLHLFKEINLSIFGVAQFIFVLNEFIGKN